LEPVRIPDPQLEGIEASVRRLMEQSAQQAQQLDHLASAPAPSGSPFAAFGMPGLGGPPAAAAPEPRPILELDGEEREDELDALQEHDDVVAWLHSLWLAYQQHKDPEAGLSGLFVWHRDFLTHALAAVRAPGGPLSACMTSPDRPAHRLLPGPPPSARTETLATAEAGGPAEPDKPTS
jgi:hypothetical protein